MGGWVKPVAGGGRVSRSVMPLPACMSQRSPCPACTPIHLVGPSTHCGCPCSRRRCGRGRPRTQQPRPGWCSPPPRRPPVPSPTPRSWGRRCPPHTGPGCWPAVVRMRGQRGAGRSRSRPGTTTGHNRRAAPADTSFNSIRSSMLPNQRTCTAMCPTPPAAALTSARWPAAGLACCSACQALSATSGTPAACSTGRLSGTAASQSSSQATYSA